MKEIALRYPRSWEEVTSEDLKIIAKQMLCKRTREDFLFEVFCRINKVRVLFKQGQDEDTPSAVYYFKRKQDKFSLGVDVIATACEELSFILDEIGLPESPINSVNRKLYEISFEQYFFANTYYSRFVSDPDNGLEFLKLMVSTLTKRNCHSIKYDEAVEIRIWWDGLQKTLSEMYPNVLKLGEGDNGEQSSPAEVLTKMLGVLNENHPERNKQILETDVHSVLQALENIYEQSKRLQNVKS